MDIKRSTQVRVVDDDDSFCSEGDSDGEIIRNNSDVESEDYDANN